MSEPTVPLERALDVMDALRAQVEELTRKSDGWLEQCKQERLRVEELTLELRHAQNEASTVRRHYLHEKACREQAEAELARVVEALEQIAKAEGRYSRDPLEHASNTIEDMVALAEAALAAARKSE